MSDLNSEIIAALSTDGPIAKETVLKWIDSTADSDLSTLSKLYRLTGEGYYRIQPELGPEATCGLILRYFLGCIRFGAVTAGENEAESDEEIETRFEATQSLHVWFRHLLGIEGASQLLTRAASQITTCFLESDDDVKDAIETGFLEHALETAALRPYFQNWANDPRLNQTWERALAWGEAHPDYMDAMYKRLEKKAED